MFPRHARLAKTLTLAALTGVAAGCGYNARDEYIATREAVVVGQPGDGSRIVVAPVDQGPSRVAAGFTLTDER